MQAGSEREQTPNKQEQAREQTSRAKETRKRKETKMAMYDRKTFSSTEMDIMAPLFCPEAIDGDADPCTYLVSKYEHLQKIMNIPIHNPSPDGLGDCTLCNDSVIKPLSSGNNPLRVVSTRCGHLFHLSCFRARCEEYMREEVNAQIQRRVKINPMECPKCSADICAAHYMEPDYDMLMVLDKQAVTYYQTIQEVARTHRYEQADLNCTIDTVRVVEEEEEGETDENMQHDNEVAECFMAAPPVAIEAETAETGMVTPPPTRPRVPANPPPLVRFDRYRNGRGFRRGRMNASITLPVASVVIPQ